MRTLAASIFLCLLTVVFAAPEDAVIDELPGVDFPITFKQYAGFLNASDTQKLFYWFVESQTHPAEDPLVLWLTGGPGCSSLSALFMENGPFLIFGAGEKLYENAYTWNKVSNMIFLESPAGVGFSYSTDGDIRTSDNQADPKFLLDGGRELSSLKHFLQLYPEYAQRDFYLAGESYAGIYIPTLASWIIQDSEINFKGLAIGNGFMSAEVIYNTLPPFLYNHNLIPEELWADVVSCCNGNPSECDYFSMMKTNKSSICYNTTIAAMSDYQEYGLDPYDIYYTCDVDSQSSLYPYSMPKSMLQRFVTLQAKGNNTDPDPNQCQVYNRTDLYLNRPDVQRALHFNTYAPLSTCNPYMNETIYVHQYENMDKQFADIFATPEIRVLLYNGDTDTMCNSVANQQYAKSLRRKQSEPMRPWTYQPTLPNVGGMVTRYDRLDYVTVRGAGHQVPSAKPGQALQVFANFLRNKPYDTPLQFL